MTNRPILDEIRRIRHAVSKEMEHDPRKILVYYAKLQQSVSSRLINRSGELVPKPIEGFTSQVDSVDLLREDS